MNERQTQIVEAATFLFLSEGVRVSTARIAKAAGVSNGTLFNAFASKQDLIDAIYLRAKHGLFAAVSSHAAGPFDREALRRFWQAYLAWGHAHPGDRRIMPVLLEAGLASEPVKAQVETMFAPIGLWFSEALAEGAIRGPSIDFIGQLCMLQAELVLSHNLQGKDEILAFDMLCQSIGLTS